ncbi:MAG: GNAT family N-acetyltransferase [Clostridia bacterium]
MSIRPYKPTDQSAVQYICHATATAKNYIKNKQLVCALYCDYYIKKEPQNCFVLTDEFDKAVGYILCSSNDKKYQRDFEPYLDIVKKMSPIEAFGHTLEQRFTKKIRGEYPAHLHIDILPSFQAKGGGRQLINTLLTHLKAQGVAGIHLSVSLSNHGAIAFYERLGFKLAKTLSNISAIYVLKL